MCAGIQYMINKATVNSDKAREEAEEAREKAEEALRRKNEETAEAIRRKDEEIDRLKAASRELYVNTLQSFGKSLKETVDGVVERFDMDQAEAEEVVARYWKSQTA